MSELRIIPPDEARAAQGGARPYGLSYRDLLHTAAETGERISAVSALHIRVPAYVAGDSDYCRCDGKNWPCETARALGVE